MSSKRRQVRCHWKDDDLNDRTAEALALVQGVLAHAREGSAAPADVVAALTALRHLRQELSDWEPELITAAREQKVSWAALAPALGVTSRQAAERRYLRLRPSDTGERTGEERVRAERDKRAGDRAVATWARDNAAGLRQLAGQVGALRGLSQPAQHQVDLVHEALADDDPTNLLTPLADTHAHLERTHTALAARIQSLTAETARIRHAAHQTRSAPPDTDIHGQSQ